jgi:hypothetical protein
MSFSEILPEANPLNAEYQARVLRKQKCDDLAFALQNVDWHKRFEGELIVVHKGEVLAHGDDRTRLLNRAANPQHPREELVVVEMWPADFESPTEIQDAH